MEDIICDRLKAQIDEQRKLIDQLAMWKKVQNQGIDPDTVDVFGFKESLLTVEQKRAYAKACRMRIPDPVTRKLEPWSHDHPYMGTRLPNGHYSCVVYNYVKLNDGTTVTLDPMVRAA